MVNYTIRAGSINRDEGIRLTKRIIAAIKESINFLHNLALVELEEPFVI